MKSPSKTSQTDPGSSSEKWLSILGNLDLDARRGEISAVHPAAGPIEHGETSDIRIRLRGLDSAGAKLFDQPVFPMINSCQPDAKRGTFEETVRLDSRLTRITLTIDGMQVDDFVPGKKLSPGQVQFGAPAGFDGHRIGVTSSAEAAANVTYTIQVRPEGSNFWQTVGIDLPRPDEGEVDINQFPGAAALDVRILQSDGFSEREIFSERRTFPAEGPPSPTPPAPTGATAGAARATKKPAAKRPRTRN